ncbi:MAG: zf-HC2 domain-containing protein [Acidobacteria bacterium]|nr:zf-HC2 domain-containing protein [Acidobacteriota bacterium]
MNCPVVQSLYPDYLDGQLSGEERMAVERHLAQCLDCEAESGQFVRLREEMRSLPVREIPTDLSVNLQVLASRELVRWRASASLPARIQYWAGQLRLAVDNLMRPLALPFAGGLTSAVFLFSALMPSLGFQRNLANDVPTPLYQEASVYVLPELVGRHTNGDTLIEVQLDEHGRVLDFSVPDGKMTSEIGNMILFAQYSPARVFGQPAPGGKILMRRSRIVVNG